MRWPVGLLAALPPLRSALGLRRSARDRRCELLRIIPALSRPWPGGPCLDYPRPVTTLARRLLPLRTRVSSRPDACATRQTTRTDSTA
eukprot:5047613-Heterocapsa_arctica.AAC.1